MAIFSRFKKPESVPEKNFPHEIPQYEMEVSVSSDNKQIIKKLVESKEKVDIYKKIQADNHGLTVQELIKRYTQGDPNIKIGIVDWKDNDFTGTTMSLVEMQAAMESAAAEWEGLDIRVREHYDHDLTKFLYGVDTGEIKTFIDSLNKPAPKVDEKKEEKTNE